VKADLLAGTCTRALYTFYTTIHRLLAHNPEIQHVRWMRRNPYPELIIFAAGSVIVANTYDHILIVYNDGEKFVVDPTAAQLGWEGWLFSRKEYAEKLAGWTLNPARLDFEREMRGLDAGNWRVRTMRDVIEECVEECENIVWGN
jgi:hypothetical protein